jgi:hypothetical protein
MGFGSAMNVEDRFHCLFRVVFERGGQVQRGRQLLELPYRDKIQNFNKILVVYCSDFLHSNRSIMFACG